MENINVSEYVLLAEASYADFSKLNNSDSIIEAIVNIGDKDGKQVGWVDQPNIFQVALPLSGYLKSHRSDS